MKTIKELYQEAYQSCQYGVRLNPDTTVFDVIGSIEHVYELIGVKDSIVREGVFACIADVMGVPHIEVYDLWVQRDSQLGDRIAEYEQAWSEAIAEQDRVIMLTNDFEQSIGE